MLIIEEYTKSKKPKGKRLMLCEMQQMAVLMTVMHTVLFFNWTGSKPIASIYSLSPSCYGSLKDVRAESFASKHFVHLIPSDTTVCSLILCNRNETTWDELKVSTFLKLLL